MSDGPWRSLEMSRAGRKCVARSAEMDASSLTEVASAVEAALNDDCRSVPRKLLVALRRFAMAAA
jgi:hypothetical protein